ncbi:MAG: DUF3347 domain-containing protein [Sphingobacteriaceae bacterium]|nr:DUF3347 domain-containing protein [Sphingobacteriaceae bacterium]
MNNLTTKISTLFVGFVFLFSNAQATKLTEESKIKEVYNQYFNLKNSLVKTDAASSTKDAEALLKALNSVEKQNLTAEELLVWNKIATDLKEHATHIAESKDIVHQRDHFISLSKNIYSLLKVSKSDLPTYYQYCPMANDGNGAHWLSKEKAVKNPYYGSRMMTCGRVVETIN